MNQRKNIILFSSFLLVIAVVSFLWNRKYQSVDVQTLQGNVLKKTGNTLTIQDQTNGIYTINLNNGLEEIGDQITLYYSGLLDKTKEVQDIEVEKIEVDSALLPTEWLEDGLFHDFYEKAYNKLKTLTLDEKIGQLLLVRYKEEDSLKELENYPYSGFVFYENAFKNKTKDDVVKMMQGLQKESKIPLLTAVDEEGGKIVRISSNPNLVSEPFKSSKELYELGGLTKIKEDTEQKSMILSQLGINLNLAPVVDVSTNEEDYIYERALGKDTNTTSKYAEAVIEASKLGSVSYTLKHFPGYGNNQDTHTGTSVDTRSYESIVNNDLPPFDAGIKKGAEAVLVSHTTIRSIDNENPASLSPSIHNILRNHLDFSGIIMTDDLDMGATSSIPNRAVKALLAGNDLLITTDGIASFSEIKNAVHESSISEDLINRIALRVIAWKYAKGLIIENEK